MVPGMLQILLLNNPLVKRGLTIPQRLCYLSSILYWLFPFSRLTFLFSPLCYLFFGLSIFDASGAEFAAYTTTYILVNYTLTYTGDDPAGATPWSTVEYVTVDGNTINSYDSFVVVPDEIDTLSTLYSGASVSGNVGLAVPADTAAQGTLAVSIDVIADKVFFAVQ